MQIIKMEIRDVFFHEGGVGLLTLFAIISGTGIEMASCPLKYLFFNGRKPILVINLPHTGYNAHCALHSNLGEGGIYTSFPFPLI